MGGHTVGAPLEAVAAGKVREAAHRVAAVERPVEVVSLVDWVAAMAEEEGLEVVARVAEMVVDCYP